MTKALPVSALLEVMAESLSVDEIVASTIKAHIATQITEWRISHKMSQRDLAEFCGVQQSTISKWENGDFNFTIEKLAEIACKLDLDLKVSMRPRNVNTASTISKAGFKNKVISLSEHFSNASISSSQNSVTYLMEG